MQGRGEDIHLRTTPGSSTHDRCDCVTDQRRAADFKPWKQCGIYCTIRPDFATVDGRNATKGSDADGYCRVR